MCNVRGLHRIEILDEWVGRVLIGLPQDTTDAAGYLYNCVLAGGYFGLD